MKNPNFTLTRILPALAMACALAVIYAQPAAAQTATSLDCRSCLTSKQIKNGSIKGKDLKGSAVTGAKIAPGAVTGTKIGPNAVNGTKIADGTVGNADLANGAVNSAKVAADSLTAGDLATDSVGAAEIAAGAVGTSEVQDNSLTANDLAPGSVTASEIATNAVGASEIATNAVTSSEINDGSVINQDIGNNAVNGAKVQGSSLNNSDIGDEAGIEFSSSGTRNVASPVIGTCGSYTVLTSFTVTVPASSNSSYVFCQASGDASLTAANQTVQVGIDNSTGTGTPDRQRFLEIEADKATAGNWENREEYAVQNVYTIGSAGGSFTYALKACRESVATTGTLRWDPLVCTVIPTRR